MSDNRKPILEVRGLTSGYGDLVVVRDLSFDVFPGELTVLLGRNGAGKTTTLRALSGLNPLLSGTVRLEGADLGRVQAADGDRQVGVALAKELQRIGQGADRE